MAALRMYMTATRKYLLARPRQALKWRASACLAAGNTGSAVTQAIFFTQASMTMQEGFRYMVGGTGWLKSWVLAMEGLESEGGLADR
jgi:hypothetical protein